MTVYSYVSAGYEGHLIQVEVYIRKGIPAFDLVGLPDGAVKEARERVKVALIQSGYDFPRGHILINLAPADIKKEGASFDLSMAVAILLASKQLDSPLFKGDKSSLVLGELELSGTIRPVKGVLPGVLRAIEGKIGQFIVPFENREEAESGGQGQVYGVHHLRDLKNLNPKNNLQKEWELETFHQNKAYPLERKDNIPDLKDLKGQAFLKRALIVSVAGGHHLLLFGPPGSGKTLGASIVEGLLPDLNLKTAQTVSRIWSQAGKLEREGGFLKRPPFRTPHHSSTLEGLIGGGATLRPGEISLAHGGVLFLDETPEFQGRIIQSLREPLEYGRVSLVRAGQSYWFPSDFQLLMAANPCPCGNLGRKDGICVCSDNEIKRYWKKIGGALMDRIDLRIPVEPVSPDILLQEEEVSSKEVRIQIEKIRKIQELRYEDELFSLNRSLPPSKINQYCFLDQSLKGYFAVMAKKLGFSSRACHSVLKVARTIADLKGATQIDQSSLDEAGQYRRFGDGNFFWN